MIFPKFSCDFWVAAVAMEQNQQQNGFDQIFTVSTILPNALEHQEDLLDKGCIYVTNSNVLLLISFNLSESLFFLTKLPSRFFNSLYHWF